MVCGRARLSVFTDRFYPQVKQHPVIVIVLYAASPGTTGRGSFCSFLEQWIPSFGDWALGFGEGVGCSGEVGRFRQGLSSGGRGVGWVERGDSG